MSVRDCKLLCVIFGPSIFNMRLKKSREMTKNDLMGLLASNPQVTQALNSMLSSVEGICPTERNIYPKEPVLGDIKYCIDNFGKIPNSMQESIRDFLQTIMITDQFKGLASARILEGSWKIRFGITAKGPKTNQWIPGQGGQHYVGQYTPAQTWTRHQTEKQGNVVQPSALSTETGQTQLLGKVNPDALRDNQAIPNQTSLHEAMTDVSTYIPAQQTEQATRDHKMTGEDDTKMMRKRPTERYERQMPYSKIGPKKGIAQKAPSKRETKMSVYEQEGKIMERKITEGSTGEGSHIHQQEHMRRLYSQGFGLSQRASDAMDDLISGIGGGYGPAVPTFPAPTATSTPFPPRPSKVPGKYTVYGKLRDLFKSFPEKKHKIEEWAKKETLKNLNKMEPGIRSGIEMGLAAELFDIFGPIAAIPAALAYGIVDYAADGFFNTVKGALAPSEFTTEVPTTTEAPTEAITAPETTPAPITSPLVDTTPKPVQEGIDPFSQSRMQAQWRNEILDDDPAPEPLKAQGQRINQDGIEWSVGNRVERTNQIIDQEVKDIGIAAAGLSNLNPIHNVQTSSTAQQGISSTDTPSGSTPGTAPTAAPPPATQPTGITQNQGNILQPPESSEAPPPGNEAPEDLSNGPPKPFLDKFLRKKNQFVNMMTEANQGKGYFLNAGGFWVPYHEPGGPHLFVYIDSYKRRHVINLHGGKGGVPITAMEQVYDVIKDRGVWVPKLVASFDNHAVAELYTDMVKRTNNPDLSLSDAFVELRKDPNSIDKYTKNMRSSDFTDDMDNRGRVTEAPLKNKGRELRSIEEEGTPIGQNQIDANSNEDKYQQSRAAAAASGEASDNKPGPDNQHAQYTEYLKNYRSKGGTGAFPTFDEYLERLAGGWDEQNTRPETNWDEYDRKNPQEQKYVYSSAQQMDYSNFKARWPSYSGQVPSIDKYYSDGWSVADMASTSPPVSQPSSNRVTPTPPRGYAEDGLFSNRRKQTLQSRPAESQNPGGRKLQFWNPFTDLWGTTSAPTSDPGSVTPAGTWTPTLPSTGTSLSGQSTDITTAVTNANSQSLSDNIANDPRNSLIPVEAHPFLLRPSFTTGGANVVADLNNDPKLVLINKLNWQDFNNWSWEANEEEDNPLKAMNLIDDLRRFGGMNDGEELLPQMCQDADQEIYNNRMEAFDLPQQVKQDSTEQMMNIIPPPYQIEGPGSVDQVFHDVYLDPWAELSANNSWTRMTQIEGSQLPDTLLENRNRLVGWDWSSVKGTNQFIQNTLL